MQILVVSPAGVDGRNAEPYKAAQRWVDGFLNTTINKPVNVTNASADLDSEAARVLGLSWTVPPHNPPAGEGSHWVAPQVGECICEWLIAILLGLDWEGHRRPLAAAFLTFGWHCLVKTAHRAAMVQPKFGSIKLDEC